MRVWIVGLLAALILDADDQAEAARLVAAMSVGGEDAATAYLELCKLIGEAADPVAATDAAARHPAGAGHAVGALVIACFASVRLPLQSRREASRARAALTELASSTYNLIGESLGSDALRFVSDLVGEAAVQLSRHSANQIAVNRIETQISLPSSVLAWQLYGDPTRGQELMERNSSGTPMLMPVVFEALSA